MRFLIIVIAASLAPMAYSCNGHKVDKADNIVSNDFKLEEISQEQDTTAFATGGASGHHQDSGRQNDPTQVSTPNTDWNKKIIKTGTLTSETENYHKYNIQIHELLKKWETYIASEQENSSSYKIENVLTIKIPVQYFDEAVQQLSFSATGKLLAKQITASDVTAEFFDTRARIETKKRIRLRYLDMVQKAKNVEEVLQVEREINSMQEQIEAAEGRINYLGHSAAYSTIQLTFFQILNSEAANGENPAFGVRLLTAVTDGSRWVGEFIIFMLTLWPIWIGAGAIILLVRRIRK